MEIEDGTAAHINATDEAGEFIGLTLAIIVSRCGMIALLKHLPISLSLPAIA